MGSAASRLRPSESKRSRPRSDDVEQVGLAVQHQIGGGARDARAPHHAVAAGARDEGVRDRFAVAQQRSDDRQVVGRVVDRRGPRPAQLDARRSPGTAARPGRASARSTPSRSRVPVRAARRDCSCPTAARRARPDASRCPTPRRTPSAACAGSVPGSGAVSTTWCRVPPAKMRPPAARPTSARSGPPVSTTASAAMNPSVVSMPSDSRSAVNLQCSRTSTPSATSAAV